MDHNKLAQELIGRDDLPELPVHEFDNVAALAGAVTVLHNNLTFVAMIIKTTWQLGYEAGREAKLDIFRKND